jgi:hypothetical protein
VPVRLLVLLLALVFVAPASASVPGAAGRIGFTSTRDGNSELYSVWPDGSAVRRLTWTSATEQSPAWAPDLMATKIAYESDVSGRFRIHVMDWDGRNAHRVSPEGSDLDEDVDPTWSPDASRLAFASTRGGGWHIWTMNADGSRLQRLTDAFGVEPTWSSNGIWIAYAWDDAIWLVHPDGSGTQRLTGSGSGSVAAPAFSPSADEIVYSRLGANGLSGELWVASVFFPGQERHLTSGGFANANPSWSPDHSEIVFQRLAPNGGWHLMAVRPDGTGLRDVTPAGGLDLTPAWGSSLSLPSGLAPAPPRIQLVSPKDGDSYLQGQNVQALYACSSTTNLVVSCTGNLPNGAPLDTSTAGTYSFAVTAVDNEGRTATTTASYAVIDVTPPTLELRTPRDGAVYELGQDVRVDYECSDNSGTVFCNANFPRGTPLPTSLVGTFFFYAYAWDASYNHTEVDARYSVVDRTPPSIVVTTPAEDAVFTLGDSVAASLACDDLSGVAYCKGPLAVPTDSVGINTYTVTAADNYGNTTTAVRRYQVVYPFSGFYAPLGADAIFRPGDDVPVKFSLGGDRGLDVLAEPPTWQRVQCASGARGGETFAASGRLSYNAAADRYLLLAATERSWAGSCLELTVKLRDGTAHMTVIRLAV